MSLYSIRQIRNLSFETSKNVSALQAFTAYIGLDSIELNKGH